MTRDRGSSYRKRPPLSSSCSLWTVGTFRDREGVDGRRKRGCFCRCSRYGSLVDRDEDLHRIFVDRNGCERGRVSSSVSVLLPSERRTRLDVVDQLRSIFGKAWRADMMLPINGR